MSTDLGPLRGTIPEEGILRSYLEWAEPTTDAPLQFHIAGGLVLASTVAGRSIWLDRGHGRLYPNIWALILAPSSFFRKSTAVSQTERILRRYRKSMYLLPNEMTPEKFIDTLANSPQGLLRWKEFAGALGQFERNYMFGFKELLTELFDCPTRYERALKGQAEPTIIENPHLNIFAASTIDWLLSKIKEGDIRGGFFSRFIYFAPTTKGKRLAFPPKADQVAESKVLNDLALLQEVSGEMTLARDARDYYKHWIYSHEDELVGHEQGSILSSFYTRLADYALKFAMLYSASADESLEISKKRMVQAIELVEFLKTNVRRLVTEELVFTRYEAQRKKVMDLLRKMGGDTDYSALLKRSHMKADELKPILRTLMEDGTLRWQDGRVWFAEFAADSQPECESKTRVSKGSYGKST